jgi:hypothetical protein
MFQLSGSEMRPVRKRNKSSESIPEIHSAMAFNEVMEGYLEI